MQSLQTAESAPFAETGPRQVYVSLLVAVVGTFLNSPSMCMFVSGPMCLSLIEQELRHGQGFGRLRNIKIINMAFSLPASCGILLESRLRKALVVNVVHERERKPSTYLP
ncbi:uncharacterized [Tachysurus ichikawai]